MKLTIAIPTYDRNEVLLATVRQIMPQVTDECELLVVDNCSPQPVALTLEPIKAQWPRANLRIVRNRVNIGGAANILRCFELGLGEWLWCTGDDDTVAGEAVAQVLRDLQGLPDATLIHYSSPVDPHPDNLTVRGTVGYINSPLSFNGMMFTPAGVYNVAKVIESLRLGYLYANSWGPHVVLALASLGQSGICAIRSYNLIVSNTGVGKENMWSPVGYLAGRQSILELPMSDESRQVLGRKMSRSPSVEYIACEMMMRARNGKAGVSEALFLYDRMVARSRMGIMAALRWKAYRLLVRWPHAGHWLVCGIYRTFAEVPFIKRNPLRALAARDRFYRA